MYDLRAIGNGKVVVTYTNDKKTTIAQVVVASLEELEGVLGAVEAEVSTLATLVEGLEEGAEVKYRIEGEHSYFVAMVAREVQWESQPQVAMSVDIHNDFVGMYITKPL